MNLITPQTMNSTTMTIIMVFLLLWVLPWKGYALWKSARNHHLKWFIICF